MTWVKEKQISYIKNIIKEDIELANNNVQNLTQIENILFISFAVKLFELIILIFTCSFIFTVFWQIVMEVQEMVWDVDYGEIDSINGYEWNFVT